MELIYLILITVGLIICFGGIYFKKLYAAFMGFIWGTILSLLITTFALESPMDADSEEAIALIVCGGIILAGISAAEERICAFLNSFAPAFFLMSMLLIYNSFLEKGVEISSAIGIAFIIALIVGIIACAFYLISFMLETAFTGAFIATLGTYGLLHGSRSIDNLLFNTFRNDEMTLFLFFGTLILGIIGFSVQWRRFIVIRDEKKSSEWICECGTKNPAEYSFCELCGKVKTEEISGTDESVWVCDCGKGNDKDDRFCCECGRAREFKKPMLPWICSNCGNENDAEHYFCNNCGAECKFKHSDCINAK